MYNWIKLAAAAVALKPYLAQTQVERLTELLNLDRRRAELAGLLLGYSQDTAVAAGFLYYVLYDEVEHAVYSNDAIHCHLVGHPQQYPCPELPDYDTLVASRLVLEGYTIKEEVGNLVYIITPSGGHRKLGINTCDCSEFYYADDCNHRKLYNVYVEKRLLFLNATIAQLIPAPHYV